MSWPPPFLYKNKNEIDEIVNNAKTKSDAKIYIGSTSYGDISFVKNSNGFSISCSKPSVSKILKEFSKFGMETGYVENMGEWLGWLRFSLDRALADSSNYRVEYGSAVSKKRPVVDDDDDKPMFANLVKKSKKEKEPTKVSAPVFTVGDRRKLSDLHSKKGRKTQAEKDEIERLKTKHSTWQRAKWDAESKKDEDEIQAWREGSYQRELSKYEMPPGVMDSETKWKNHMKEIAKKGVNGLLVGEIAGRHYDNMTKEELRKLAKSQWKMKIPESESKFVTIKRMLGAPETHRMESPTSYIVGYPDPH